MILALVEIALWSMLPLSERGLLECLTAVAAVRRFSAGSDPMISIRDVCMKKFFASIPMCALTLLFGGAAFAAQGLEVRVLSSRADMVSGGNALIEITLGDSALSDRVSATLNSQTVTNAFRQGRTPRSLIGRVEGMAPGKNTLEVRADKLRARVELINHPSAGPVFAGPKQTPFVCQTEASGLGAPLDSDCSIKPVVTYFHKSTKPPAATTATASAAPTAPVGFRVFESSAPRPDDLAQVTTGDGRTVDYIVRDEKGTINRAIYEIAFLHQPGQPLPDPWSGPTPGWNGRLIYSFGGGCSPGYRQGIVRRGAVADVLLARGYAVATSSQNVFGNNCDDVISAETTMMVKEHFIEQFGMPVHTIGLGGSGGSMQVYLIAQNYPGLLDAIGPSGSFPDITSLITPVVDCSLLTRAFQNSTQKWTDEQKTAVSGFADFSVCGAGNWQRYSPAWVRADNCDPAIGRDQVYDPARNSKGVRCSLYDNEVNVYGRDRKTGFARRPLDNVGVQYGLAAFNAGKISADQFLELNETIGGFDYDGNLVRARSVADPAALRIAYQTGRVNTGGGSLGSIPIIDYRTYVDPNIHDKIRTYEVQARLIAAHGNSDNMVIFTAPRRWPATAAPPEPARLLDRWLDNIASDTSEGSAAVKTARNKPVEARDACWTPSGEQILEPQTHQGPGRCNELYPVYGDPRIAAGAPLTNDVLKCTLKPVDPQDYSHRFTDDQLSRLKAIFRDGVCNYRRPGVEQQPLKGTWLKY